MLCQDNLNEIMYPSYVQGRSLETAGRSTLDNQYSQKVHENFVQNKFSKTVYTRQHRILWVRFKILCSFNRYIIISKKLNVRSLNRNKTKRKNQTMFEITK